MAGLLINWDLLILRGGTIGVRMAMLAMLAIGGGDLGIGLPGEGDTCHQQYHRRSLPMIRNELYSILLHRRVACANVVFVGE